jgi:hypothetical protein
MLSKSATLTQKSTAETMATMPGCGPGAAGRGWGRAGLEDGLVMENLLRAGQWICRSVDPRIRTMLKSIYHYFE